MSIIGIKSVRKYHINFPPFLSFSGYHKVGNCDDQVKKYKCKKCEDGFYTDIENYIEKCLRCDLCNRKYPAQFQFSVTHVFCLCVKVD